MYDYGALKVAMTGSASDPMEWQRHIRNKPRREALFLREIPLRETVRVVQAVAVPEEAEPPPRRAVPSAPPDRRNRRFLLGLNKPPGSSSAEAGRPKPRPRRSDREGAVA